MPAPNHPEVKIEAHKFHWNQKANTFDSADPPIPDSDPSKKVIEDLMKTIESKSGIKKIPFFLIYIGLITLVILGYVLAYFLIQESMITLGGIIIIITPFISYFGFVGYTLIAGTQASRANNYMDKTFKRFTEKLKPYDFKIWYSFTKSNKKFLINF